MDDLPICDCGGYWPGQGHHPECPVRHELERLRAELAECRAAASDAAHMLEIARVWGGLDWSWTNLHHSIAKCAWEKLTDALAAKEKVK